ncbi:hypothetical protein HYH02_004086 [Chlamydomonas schloesseri]|uniref:Uncharacterized protein n=1 Tax=Chlamydomonas schloesseri TaxID=2026947 RepID=A0A835WQH8_9CHLO|nr:hypothetical protein HYH02_004086 [Chlamydomonas schloesseri]|eukprot:KAG2451488.1 hypothetical protein HYH02_004086 [Chlamydomonas schloesseri]
MARVASGRVFDIENVDPATGLLSTLRNSSSAPVSKASTATIEARAPFSELSLGLFQGQSQDASAVLVQAPLVFTAPAAKDKPSLFGSSLSSTWAAAESVPSASTAILRKMR